MYPRSFLAKYSGFFAGLFRNSHSEHVEIKLPYPRDVIKCLFKHLDGETLNLTLRKEAMLKEVVDFLILEEPFVTSISEKVKSFKFSMTGRHKKALDFLFRHFISVLVSKLKTSGDVQSVYIREHGFVSPGSLHANSGEHEFSNVGGIFVRADGDRKTYLSRDPFSETIEKD